MLVKRSSAAVELRRAALGYEFALAGPMFRKGVCVSMMAEGHSRFVLSPARGTRDRARRATTNVGPPYERRALRATTLPDRHRDGRTSSRLAWPLRRRPLTRVNYAFG